MHARMHACIRRRVHARLHWHTQAYAGIRRHTQAYAGIRTHTHTSARIRTSLKRSLLWSRSSTLLPALTFCTSQGHPTCQHVPRVLSTSLSGQTGAQINTSRNHHSAPLPDQEAARRRSAGQRQGGMQYLDELEELGVEHVSWPWLEQERVLAHPGVLGDCRICTHRWRCRRRERHVARGCRRVACCQQRRSRRARREGGGQWGGGEVGASATQAARVRTRSLMMDAPPPQGGAGAQCAPRRRAPSQRTESGRINNAVRSHRLLAWTRPQGTGAGHTRATEHPPHGPRYPSERVAVLVRDLKLC